MSKGITKKRGVGKPKGSVTSEATKEKQRLSHKNKSYRKGVKDSEATKIKKRESAIKAHQKTPHGFTKGHKDYTTKEGHRITGDKLKKDKIAVTCKYCGKIFKVIPYRVKTAKYHCKKCMYADLTREWKRGPENGNFIDGMSITPQGYVEINTYMIGMRYKNAPYTILAHIFISEVALNRKLRKGEIIHHIDQDRSNFKEENLYLFKNRSAHSLAHHRNELPTKSNLREIRKQENN